MPVYQEGARLKVIADSTPASQGVPPKPWGVPAILLVLIVPTALWASSLFADAPEDLTNSEIIASIVLVVVFKDALFIGVAAGFALWRYRLGWSGLGFRAFDRDLWWLPLATVSVMIVGMIAYGLVLIGLGVEQPDQGFDAFFDTRALLPLTALAFVIIAPISEETFFRGFIFAGLIRPFGLPAAMAVSGLLFGALHVSNLNTLALLVPIGLIGVALAWLYNRTGSIWPSIFTHMLFNAFGFLGGVAGS